MECGNLYLQCFDTFGWATGKRWCWLVGGDCWTGALHKLLLQLSPLTTSIILSPNKIQNGDILVPA